MKKKLGILFIHGFRSDLNCWANMYGLLVKENISKDCQIEHFEYATGFLSTLLYKIPNNWIFRLLIKIKFLKSLFFKISSIQEISEEIITFIEYVFKDVENVMIVAHSMGGLVARNYVYKHLVEYRLPNFKIIKILFYSSPTFGTEYANIMQAYFQDNIQLEELSLDSDFINNLNNEWFKIPGVAKIATLNVVSSSDPYLDIPRMRGYWGNDNSSIRLVSFVNHESVIRPTRKTDLTFRILLTEIETALKIIDINDENNVDEETED